VVRHTYEKALQLAKKQRKQRQRVLGKEQGGKKKLLYSPQITTTEEFEALPLSMEMPVETTVEMPDMTAEMATETYVKPAAPSYKPAPATSGGLTLDSVISYLQNFHHANLQNEALKSENERLKRDITELRKQNEELSNKIAGLEQNTETIQEDYETLMKIMNRARKLVLFEEEERPATKFKMDRNGNLEKVAE